MEHVRKHEDPIGNDHVVQDSAHDCLFTDFDPVSMFRFLMSIVLLWQRILHIAERNTVIITDTVSAIQSLNLES